MTATITEPSSYPDTHAPAVISLSPGPGRGRRNALLAALAVLALGTAGFGASRLGSGQSANPPPAGNDAPVVEGNAIRFSDAFAARAKLISELPREEAIAPVVSVVGTVTYDPQRFAAVGARTSGRVHKLHRLVGDDVKTGDVLVELESAELGRAEAQVLATRAKEHVAEVDMKRERRLADAHISSERDAELAAASYQAARSERIASERAVQALGGDFDAHLGNVTLKSPISGRVIASKAARGETLEPADTLFEIADLAVLWVELRVFERDLSFVRKGDRVEIIVPAASGTPLVGSVAHVGDVIDPGTRTGVVRVVVENTNRVLRPGQSVTARLQTTAGTTTSLGVPLRAVTRVDGKPTVFVQHDKNRVEPRSVVLGPEDSERTAVLEGLKPGERVIVDGMFSLKSELFR